MLETLDLRERMATLNRILIKELEVLELGSKIQSQVQSELGKNQRDYFLREQLKAIQRELGEGDDQAKEIEELREKIDAAGMPEAVKKEAIRELDRLAKMPVAAAEYTVARTYIDWLIALPWAKRADEVIDLAAHEGHPRRRPLGPREGQGPDPRVPGGAQAQPRREGADPLLRGAARRGQDVAGQVDRHVARPQVRPRLARRHARRGRDPRPPAHLHRRAARPGHPGPAPRRVEEPGVHPRRDRQAGLGLPRRPGVGAARGARPGAEQHVPRPLPRRAVRPLGGAVHHDREHPRPGPAGAARPHGGARAARLHRGGEAPDRRRAPGREAGAEPRPDARVHRLLGRRPAHRDSRLHARGRRAEPRARDRRPLPEGGADAGRGPRGARHRVTPNS